MASVPQPAQCPICDVEHDAAARQSRHCSYCGFPYQPQTVAQKKFLLEILDRKTDCHSLENYRRSTNRLLFGSGGVLLGVALLGIVLGFVEGQDYKIWTGLFLLFPSMFFFGIWWLTQRGYSLQVYAGMALSLAGMFVAYLGYSLASGYLFKHLLRAGYRNSDDPVIVHSWFEAWYAPFAKPVYLTMMLGACIAVFTLVYFKVRSIPRVRSELENYILSKRNTWSNSG